MRITWQRQPEEHPGVGRLDPEQQYDVPDELGAAWIAQGAARPAHENRATHRGRVTPPAEE